MERDMERIYEYALNGEMLKVSIGKVAEQAGGACLVTYGDTVVLVTATASKTPRNGIDFFPLSVDYEEKMYAVGKIPGGFIKREGKASDKAVLTSRLIDRPIRPLFPEGYRNDVQVIATVLSVDHDHSPEIAAMIGSSIALSISDIPFDGPTGSVAVGMVDGKLVLNPTVEQSEKSELDLVVSGTKDAIMMVEAKANIIPEEKILEAILFGHEEIKKICEFVENIANELGKEKQEYEVFMPEEELRIKVEEFGTKKILEAVNTVDKMEREVNLSAVKEEIMEEFLDEEGTNKGDIKTIIEDIVAKEVRRLIVEEGIRPDNRTPEEIRPIWSEVGTLPRVHGSGLFTRGQTQVLTVATLGVLSEAQTLDGLSLEDGKRYMHHYNFPPFSVGDTKPMRAPSRREVGHGALAEKALLPVIPSEDEFPYTLRLVSEVLSSNGSSSQASVCGSTLALLDAGVPIKSMVAGIAMGLIEENGKIAVLSDIQGLEDHLGDMDFKVAGTRDGVTAIQMDIKISGISKEVLEEALKNAYKGRMHILGKMEETITAPREELSKYAPRIYKLEINPDKIRDIIGPGGKVINQIIDETGVKIDIEDDGKVFVAATEAEAGEKAIEIIKNIVKEIEVGETYVGKVTKIMNFGAFVDILNGKEGLVHISNLAHERVKTVEDVVKVGDEVAVKVCEIDNQGRINLSRKALLPKIEEEQK